MRSRRIRHGMDSPARKLTAANVRTIRQLAETHSTRVLARMFGVSHTQVHRILRGRKWRRLA